MTDFYTIVETYYHMMNFYSHRLHTQIKPKYEMKNEDEYLKILVTEQILNKIKNNKFIDLENIFLEIVFQNNKIIKEYFYLKFTNKTEEILFLLQE
jgi:hypothetical protein